MSEQWRCVPCGERFAKKEDAEEHLKTPGHHIERTV